LGNFIQLTIIDNIYYYYLTIIYEILGISGLIFWNFCDLIQLAYYYILHYWQWQHFQKKDWRKRQ